MPDKHRVHFMLSTDLYEKLRHVSFYERQTVSDIMRRLVVEYLEEKAIDEPDFFLSRDL